MPRPQNASRSLAPDPATAFPLGVVLGDGPVARAIAGVLGFPRLGDDALALHTVDLPDDFGPPLKRCRHVVQIVSPSDPAWKASWRAMALAETLCPHNREPLCVPRLSWIFLADSPSGADPVPEFPDGLCPTLGPGPRLSGILHSLAMAERLEPQIWLGFFIGSQSARAAAVIKRILLKGEGSARSRDEILALRADVGDANWERFISLPSPENHIHANKIRRWLLNADAVGPSDWFHEGRRLIHFTSIPTHNQP